jgi:hypothetical protein
VLVVTQCFWSPDAAGQPAAASTRHLVEELRIDGVKEDLTSIGFLLVLPDTSIVISQPQDSRLILFDKSGRRTATFGRSGQGPGEFATSPTQPGLPNQGAVLFGGLVADTVWVYDFLARRMTFVSARGTLIRTVPLSNLTFANFRRSGIPNDLSMLAFRPVGLPAGADIVGRAVFDLTDSVRAQRIRAGLAIPPGREDYVLASSSNRTLRSVLATERPRRVTIQPAPGQTVAAPVPFTVTPTVSVSQDGSIIAVLSFPQTIAATGTAQLRFLDYRGDTLWTRPIPFRGMPVSRASADSAVEVLFRQYYVSRNGRPPSIPRNVAMELEERVRALVPSHVVPFGDVRLGIDHTLWLWQRWTLSSDQPSLLMFDSSGRLEASIVLPQGAGLSVASRERIWFIDMASDGIQSVVRYRIR